MKCRSCAAEIAEKAIVCYRCGTPTAVPVRQPSQPSRRRPSSPLAAVVTILLLIAAGFWLIPKTPPGAARWGAWTALVGVVVGVAWFFKRRAGVRIH